MKISIVIPIYKTNEKLLKRCFKSIEEQEYKNLEIIIISDGATKDNLKIAEDFSKRDNRVRVIKQKNAGPSNARNNGIKKCTGEYLMFVDSDDWIESHTILECVNELENLKDLDILLFGMKRDFQNRSEDFGYDKYQKKEQYINEKIKNLMIDIVDENVKIEGPVAKIFNIQFLRDNNLFFNSNTSIAEDMEFNLRTFSKAKKILVMDKCYYHYVCNLDSLTNNTSYEFVKSGLNNFKKMDNFIKENDFDFMQEKFDDRVLCFIVASYISGIFSPQNRIKYQKRIEMSKELKSDEFVKEKIRCKNNVSKSRKIVLFFIKHNLHLLIYIMAYIRYIQKKIK